MDAHSSTSDYEHHRELIYQSLPHLRAQMQWLDFTFHRFRNLTGEAFDDAFANLIEQQHLRSAGADRYELVGDYGRDQIGLLLRCDPTARMIQAITYTNVSIRPIITTIFDRRKPEEPSWHDCQNESYQSKERYHSGQENPFARGRGGQSARPCRDTAWITTRTPCHNYDPDSFWS